MVKIRDVKKVKNQRKSKVCPKCHGAGEYPHPMYKGLYIKCGTCAGIGLLIGR